MSLNVRRTPSGLYLASATPPHVMNPWSTDQPVSLRQLIEELRARGCHQQDIGDALYQQDPQWLEKSQGQNLCPVCGCILGFAPWCESSPSHEICPCCLIQFGYDDFAGGDPSKRSKIYLDSRQLWMAEGMPWRSRGQKPPLDWDPAVQLARVDGHVARRRNAHDRNDC